MRFPPVAVSPRHDHPHDRRPGAVLSYEVLGSGPVLALIGHPMPADGFRPLAEQLAGSHTVVLHDPRGTGASTMTDPTEPPDVATLADDLSRVLAAVTTEPADVLGSSGGGITALELAATTPEQVRAVVAHEPPLITYLDDAAAHRANGAEVQRVHREEGLLAAMGEFAGRTAPAAHRAARRGRPEGDDPLVLGLGTVTEHRVGDSPRAGWPSAWAPGRARR